MNWARAFDGFSLALVIISLIWAVAWVKVERIKQCGDDRDLHTE